MHRISIALASAALAVSIGAAPASAAGKPPELATDAAAHAQVGATTFRVLFWRVFDASLWSPSGNFDWNAPFALSLTYARDFSADQLTETTVEEMGRISGEGQAAFASFGRDFKACVADVVEGDRITAVSESATRTRLFLNGAERCVLERKNLRRDFFGIWLSRDSQFPEATARLIGDPA